MNTSQLENNFKYKKLIDSFKGDFIQILNTIPDEEKTNFINAYLKEIITFICNKFYNLDNLEYYQDVYGQRLDELEKQLANLKNFENDMLRFQNDILVRFKTDELRIKYLEDRR